MRRFRKPWLGHVLVVLVALVIALAQTQQTLPTNAEVLLLLFVCFLEAVLCPKSGYGIPSSTGNPPIVLEWNLGQAGPGADFVARTQSGYGIRISADQAVVTVKRTGETVRTKLAGRSGRPKAEPEGLLPGKFNYFLGPDPDKWVTDVPTFQRVRYRDAYPGIDVVWYGNGSNLEYDFIVKPGSDPAAIRMEFEGARSVMINADGDMATGTLAQDVVWKKPQLYQDTASGRRRIEGRYKVVGATEVAFEVGAYDPSRPLVIDPEIRFASYLGGQRNEYGSRTAIDEAGNVYVTGSSNDPFFPLTPGAFNQGTRPADSADAIITKFRADGGGLVYSTYIGGLSDELAGAIAVDRGGNAYITGYTVSTGFPTTPGVIRRQLATDTPNNGFDCFLVKLNAAGNQLVYSTLLGGRQVDACTALAIDAAGNATVVGGTSSNDFPVSETAFQPQRRIGFADPGFDGFIARINPTATAILASSYFGGNGIDIPAAVALDSAGNSYIVGATNSNAAFPVTEGVIQPRYRQAGAIFDRAQFDGFVLKVNPAASTLLFGTYLGGGGTDIAFGVALDAQNNVHVCGNTTSTDFPLVTPALQGAFRGSGGQLFTPLASGDAFVSKLNPTATALIYSTYLGGTRDDRATGCVVDSAGAIHVAGYTVSTDFPVSNDAAQRTFGGTTTPNLKTGDAFYAKLDATGRAIQYATYYGGQGDDAALGIALGPDGSVYLSGSTGSSNLTTLAGAYQRVYGGAIGDARGQIFGDAFVVKIGDPPRDQTPPPAIASVVSAASGIGGGIAPGELVTVGVSNLRATGATAQASNGRFPTEVQQVKLFFDSSEAVILGVTPSSISAIAPFGVAGRSTTTMVVEEQGLRSAPLSVPVVATKPALFTTSAAGRGQAQAFNEDGAANSVDAPAVAGSILTLLMTGGGVTEPASRDGVVPTEDDPPLAAPVAVMFGDSAVEEIFYSGGAAGRVAGTAKISLRLPAGLPTGDIPVTVTVGGVASQSGVTVAVVQAPAPTVLRPRR